MISRILFQISSDKHREFALVDYYCFEIASSFSKGKIKTNQRLITFVYICFLIRSSVYPVLGFVNSNTVETAYFVICGGVEGSERMSIEISHLNY